MTHKIHIDKKYLQAIESGQKRVELRLYDDKRKQIQVGDIIDIYESGTDSFFWSMTVLALHRFNTFKELFNTELFRKSISEDLSIDEAVCEMHKIYKEEDEIKYGVVGIEFEPIWLHGCGGR